MKIGITCGGIGPFASGDYIRRSAMAAERAGFAHYWLPEHVVQFATYPESSYPYAGGSGQEVPVQDPEAPLQFGDDTMPLVDPRNPLIDPIIGLTWAAAATSRIELGTNILILPQRNPVLLAKELATLDSFCGGRCLAGIGVGWAREESDAMGVDFASRGKRTDEAIRAMRELWHEPASSFSGKFYNFKNAYCFPKPARAGGVPVLVGGESKAALLRVARLGDGWLPYNLPACDAAGMISKLKEMTEAQGRNPETLRIIKIIYSSAKLDELELYRAAGVTEFNLASNGEIPTDDAGMAQKFAEFGQTLVAAIADW